MNRRSFIQAILASAATSGSLGVSHYAAAQAVTPGFASISSRILINTLLDGGPDMRHLIVPKPSNTPNTFGFEYWSNRFQVHRIGNNFADWMTRFNDDYFPVTVNGTNWGASGVNLIDSGGLNSNVEFGIWREAGWLIDQFLKGNAALVFNTAGASSRAHDRASLQLNQGDIEAELDQVNRSGWGGRLARVASGSVVSVTNTPDAFCFGPRGSALNFNPNIIDNRMLLSVPNSREYGLSEFRQTSRSLNNGHRRLARSLNRYYDNLRTGAANPARPPFDKPRNHEATLRNFGNLLRERLDTVSVPSVIQALGDEVSIGGQAVNPGANGNPRRTLRNRGFARQVENLFDSLAANDILNSRVISLEYRGFDTHAGQRGSPVQRNGVVSEGPELDNLRIQLNDPNRRRNIESNFKDLFGGPFVLEPNAPHSAFSALQQGLTEVGAAGVSRLVYTFAGEFGRQIRGNGDNGTDHGSGNLVLVIGSRVRGGVYGQLFPDNEIPLYGNSRLNTPDIETLTHTDFLFGAVSDWVQPNSSQLVYPRLANLAGGDAPILESGVDFSGLIS